MDHDRAKEIIRSLADGRDPATGEQFPPDSPYQQAHTVRALFMPPFGTALENRVSGTSSLCPPRPAIWGQVFDSRGSSLFTASTRFRSARSVSIRSRTRLAARLTAAPWIPRTSPISRSPCSLLRGRDRSQYPAPRWAAGGSAYPTLTRSGIGTIQSDKEGVECEVNAQGQHTKGH
jgi:hypothetical protein